MSIVFAVHRPEGCTTSRPTHNLNKNNIDAAQQSTQHRQTCAHNVRARMSVPVNYVRNTYWRLVRVRVCCTEYRMSYLFAPGFYGQPPLPNCWKLRPSQRLLLGRSPRLTNAFTFSSDTLIREFLRTINQTTTRNCRTLTRHIAGLRTHTHTHVKARLIDRGSMREFRQTGLA